MSKCHGAKTKTSAKSNEVTAKERPVSLFDHEVRAVLEDRQTQARRVVKPQPVLTTARGTQVIGDEFHEWPAGIIRRKSVLVRDMIPKCPYGLPGARLWAQEAFALYDDSSRRVDRDALWYKADLSAKHFTTSRRLLKTKPRMAKGEQPEKHLPWKFPIHLPRWASRLLLEVTEVRVERVQDIGSNEYKLDVFAEGVCEACEHDGILHHQTETDPEEICGGRGGMGCLDDDHPIQLFRKVWDSINLKRGFGWEKNPFVWVLTFRRVGK